MGAFYILGIVKRFEARSTQPLSQIQWVKRLNERIDLKQYTTTFAEYTAKGELKVEVFEENIETFYNKLVEITGDDT